MPASVSAPIEPYLKRIAGCAVTQSGCGSSRKILYQAVKPTIAPSSSNTSSVHQSQWGFHWNDFFAAGEGVAMTVSCGRSERLEERHQRVLVGFGKLGAVRSEKHTSELQYLMRRSYAVFCLKKKK